MLISASDGIKLEARSVGSGAPLVLAHEFSSDARSWEAQVGYFSRYYRCTAYCARGYPPSDVPPAAGAYGQIRAAEDLADVVRAVCDGPAHVIGLSMGGFAALHLGLRHPQLVRSLVVAGVGYGAKPEQQAEHGISSRREADHAETVGMIAFARALAFSSYAQCLRAKDESGWSQFAQRLSEHSVTGMAMTLRGVLATRPSLWHLADALRGLDRPLLLVVGDEDTPCLEPNLFLKSVLPDAALCVMPRTGHLINLEEPSLFNAIVFSFLAAVERGCWREWKGGSPARG
ncbi:MAG TPA: alpha/beta hydrolase [Xanthobacteraceae bacterium]|jgi:pimeloyl-ACP methyl ester carboxylesterase